MKTKFLQLVLILLLTSKINIGQTLLPYFSSSTNVRNITNYWGINGTNITEPGLGWSNSNLQNKIGSLNSSTIRFPGGTNANWWDWRKGGYIDAAKYINNNCYGLPFGYGSINPVNDNTLSNFKLNADIAIARPVFVLNLLTSTLSDQLAMLEEAQQLGFAFNEVELGNEFYVDKCEHYTAFPDGASYATTAAKWTQAIHERFGTSMHVGWVAATSSVTDTDLRKNWNSTMVAVINTLTTSFQKPDAFIIHHYKAANIGSGSGCSGIEYNDLVTSSNPNITCNAKNWQKYFFSVYNSLLSDKTP